MESLKGAEKGSLAERIRVKGTRELGLGNRCPFYYLYLVRVEKWQKIIKFNKLCAS